MIRIELKITQDRVIDELTIEELCAMDEKKPLRLVMSGCAHFMIDPDTGDYFPHDVALNMLNKLKLKEARAIFDEVQKKVELSAVPPVNPGGLPSRSNEG